MYNPEKYQAEAFGWLAMAIAPRDKATGFALVDRALALPIDKPEPFGSYTYFGAGSPPRRASPSTRVGSAILTSRA